MKKLILSIVMVVMVISMASSCTMKPIDEKNKDSLKFKEEYEALNKDALEMNIPENNKMKYATYNEVMEMLESGTGVIYFGFPQCPWCRNAVPVLINSASDTDLKEILYFNALSIRDKKHLDDNGNIVVDQEGTEEYYKLIEKLSSVLGPYDGLNDSSIKRLYFPTVVFVKDGNIIMAHEGTVESQTDPSKPLSKIQTEELYQIYVDSIQKILGLLCDKDSAC